MNFAALVGRLTKEPEIKYTSGKTPTAYARFTLAIDRGKDKDGNDKGADFPTVTAWGKTAENIERYVKKGDRICVIGRIQTGSFEKDGQKIYTTEVVADRVEFLETKPKNQKPDETDKKTEATVPGFEYLDNDDIPF